MKDQADQLVGKRDQKDKKNVAVSRIIFFICFNCMILKELFKRRSELKNNV